MALKQRPIFFLLMLCWLIGGSASAGAAYNNANSAAGEMNESADTDRENNLLQQINQVRSRKNLQPLAVDSRLSEAAYLHSLDMAQNDFFSHQGSDGSNAAQRIEQQGYDWRFVAENLSCGLAEPALVLQEWMNSPEHRKNILHPQAEHIGIGIVVAETRECSPYWTADFASEQ